MRVGAGESLILIHGPPWWDDKGRHLCSNILGFSMHLHPFLSVQSLLTHSVLNELDGRCFVRCGTFLHLPNSAPLIPSFWISGRHGGLLWYIINVPPFCSGNTVWREFNISGAFFPHRADMVLSIAKPVPPWLITLCTIQGCEQV